jgi:negative regulator of flagellin synthesis FlgM
MKIENTLSTATAALANEPAATRAGQKNVRIGTPDGPNHGPADSVRLSNQLQNIANRLANAETFDKARVDAIRQAIDEGRFTVNTAKVADRLLEAARELVPARQG